MTTMNEPVSRPGLLARVKGILLQPRREWEVIDRETASVGSLYLGYVAPLAAIPALAKMIGGLVFGYGVGFMGFGVHWKPTVPAAVTEAVLTYVLSLVGVFLLALIIDALAPTFGGQKNRIQALKVAAYGGTAAWIAGVFNLVPALGVLGILGLYSLYLYYRGLPPLMKTPEDKALPYTAVVILCAIVMYLLTAMIAGGLLAASGMGRTAGLGAAGGAGSVTVNGNTVNLGQLEQAAKQMEAAAAAGASGGGAAAGAGAATSVEALQALLPTTLGGLPRTNVSSGSGGVAGLQASGAKAEYGAGDMSIELSVSDVGAMGGLAGAFNVQSSQDDGTRYEKIGQVNGRMTTEEYDRSANTGTYGFLVGNRFMVQAEGRNVTIDQLKAATGSVNVGQLERMAR